MASLQNDPSSTVVEPRTVPASSSTGVADTTFSDALMTIRKRKWIIIGAAILGLAYGFYKAVTQPRLYEAFGRIEIRTGSSNQFRVNEGGGLSEGAFSNRIPSEVTILKSDSLLFSVAQDLDLANKPDFTGNKSQTHADIDNPAVRQNILNAMQGAINVAAVPKTDIIRITCHTYSPKLSADIINKLVDEYISRSFKSRVYSTQRASDWLTGQLDTLKHQVETSQEQMIDLQKRLGVLAIDPTHSQISASLDELTKAAGEAQIARILAESRYRVLTGMDPNSLDSNVASTPGAGAQGAPTSQLPTLRGQRETLMAQYAQLNTTLGPSNPQLKALKNQIDELTRQIGEEQKRTLNQAKETFVAARAAEDQTRAALEAERNSAYKLRDDLVEYTLRQREFESNRTLYESLLQRLRTAGVQAGLESTEIDIVDPAVPPATPSLRTRSSMMLIYGVIATVIGIVLAFIMESLDTGLRNVAEIEEVSGLPSLALIPRARRTGIDLSNLSVAQRNLAVLSAPKSQFSEAFRALRTSLLLSTAGRLPKTILLTSATPSEGKTTVSTNLSTVLAQRDVRVLLIDADLRRPTIHHRLGLNGKTGLTSVLTGSLTLEQAIQNVPDVPMLDVLVSGPVPPFPTEMLSSEAMEKLLEHCRGIYTHIVIDSPPLLSVTDGVVLARDADAVVLIVRHGRSSKHAVRRSRDLLLRAGATVTGIALNAVDLNSPEYYGYYGYTGYGGYSGYGGYGSSGVDAAGWESKSESKAKKDSSTGQKGDSR